MFEAKVNSSLIWKKLIEAIKDMVQEANFQCTPAGMSIQAMDSAHVALVHLLLHRTGFELFNNERNSVLGVNLMSLGKILKTTENQDTITIRHENDSDVMTLTAESDGTKTSEYTLKLMEIEADAMGIPEMEYKSHISIPSSEFAKICRDMNIFGDTVTVAVTNDGVRFSANSDMGDGTVFLKAGSATSTKKEKDVKDELKSEKKVKEEQDDDDVPFAMKASAKKEASGAADGVVIDMEEEVTLSFALRYFNTFAKGASLADSVHLYLARDSPCMVEYRMEGLGHLRYYLAPKVDANE